MVIATTINGAWRRCRWRCRTHIYKTYIQQWPLCWVLVVKVKVKAFPYSIPALGPELIPVHRQLAPQVTISHLPGGRLLLLSARPAVTSPAAEHHHPLAGTKLYCLVTEAHRCKQLAQACYAALPRVGFEPATYWSQSPTLNPLHYRATSIYNLPKVCQYLSASVCQTSAGFAKQASTTAVSSSPHAAAGQRAKSRIGPDSLIHRKTGRLQVPVMPPLWLYASLSEQIQWSCLNNFTWKRIPDCDAYLKASTLGWKWKCCNCLECPWTCCWLTTWQWMILH